MFLLASCWSTIIFFLHINGGVASNPIFSNFPWKIVKNGKKCMKTEGKYSLRGPLIFFPITLKFGFGDGKVKKRIWKQKETKFRF